MKRVKLDNIYVNRIAFKRGLWKHMFGIKFEKLRKKNFRFHHSFAFCVSLFFSLMVDLYLPLDNFNAWLYDTIYSVLYIVARTPWAGAAALYRIGMCALMLLLSFSVGRNEFYLVETGAVELQMNVYLKVFSTLLSSIQYLSVSSIYFSFGGFGSTIYISLAAMQGCDGLYR